MRASWISCGVLAVCLVASAARSADSDPLIVEVAGHGLRASDVQRRLAAMPEFQRRTLGATPAEQKRKLVDTVLLPELRLSAAADASRLETTPFVRSQLRDALRRALVEHLRAEIAREPVPEASVAAYYQAHRAEFEQPFRIRIARILVADEALARKVIEESRGDQGLVRWKQLARDHSLDSATKLRGGILGFVGEDGKADVPQLAVDPALFAAASQVKDGELVAAPVREGENFAAVWRRGTSPRVSRSLEEARAQIQFLLREERLQQRIAEVVTRRRAEDVKEENPELLEAFRPADPVIAPAPRPSGTPAPADPTPKVTEQGLR